MKPDLSPRAVWAARVLAATADLLQIVLLPAFFPGVASAANDILDLALAVGLIVLVGWHWAFLPAFLAELVPFADLVPTWTAAVFVATRGRAAGPEPPTPVEVVPPPALPPAAQTPRGPSGS